MNKFLTIFLLCLTSLAHSHEDSSICYLRDPGGRIREHNVDFLTMNLTVNFNTLESQVIGNVKYEFKPIQYLVDTLFLNAPNINIKSVKVNGQNTPFDTNKEGLTIRFTSSLDWHKTYKLDIDYIATPRRGLYFVGWNVPDKNPTKNRYFTRKQIWTQGQGIDNRHWIPCYDDVNDKLITSTTITFDSAYTVIANGALKKKTKNTNGTTTWSFAMDKPMVPYLIMIAIDKYTYKDYKSKNGMVSRQYFYSNLPETVIPTYQFSGEMMDWLSSEFQVAYPWQVYSNTPVQEFMFGAMENTTATIYGDFSLNDSRGVLDRAYLSTNAHELTHQWFGDYITEYSAQHHWLHESFATYYAKQFVRQVQGEEKYQMDKRGEANSAIWADKRDRFPVAHSEGGSSRHYPKGSFVIDMLRYTVSDSVYRKCITAYLKKHAYGNVSNHDFMMSFMETAGINLDWFFDQWVYRAGVPNYEVYTEYKTDKTIFYVNQTHKVDELTGYFKMPIQFKVHYTDNSTSAFKTWISGPSDTVVIPNSGNKTVAFALFDVGCQILKTTTFNKPYPELAAQAEQAENYIDRYDAVVGMRSVAMDTKRDLLLRLFNKEKFHSIRNEVVFQLKGDSSENRVPFFKKALNDKDHQVRRETIQQMDSLPIALIADVEKMLSDSSYINVELALRKLTKQFPENTKMYLTKTQNEIGLNNNIRMAWLEIAIKSTTDSTEYRKHIAELAIFTSNQFEFRTRTRAFDVLEEIKYADDQVLRNLIQARLSANSRLSNPAMNTLKTLFRNKAYKDQVKTIIETSEWKDWEKEIVQKIID
jgi:aminopeptidase N